MGCAASTATHSGELHPELCKSWPLNSLLCYCPSFISTVLYNPSIFFIAFNIVLSLPVSASSLPISKPISTSSKSSNHSGPKNDLPNNSSSVIPLPSPSVLNSPHNFDSDPPLEFTFEQLVEATDNFSDVFVIGEGGFGKVYQGWLLEKTSEKTTRRQVAVKKLNPEGLQGFNEWLVSFKSFFFKFPIKDSTFILSPNSYSEISSFR